MVYHSSNCHIFYKIFMLKVNKLNTEQLKGGEICVSTKRAARNMSFQKLTPENGKVSVEAELTGMDIIGVKLSAPLTQHEVRIFFCQKNS